MANLSTRLSVPQVIAATTMSTVVAAIVLNGEWSDELTVLQSVLVGAGIGLAGGLVSLFIGRSFTKAAK